MDATTVGLALACAGLGATAAWLVLHRRAAAPQPVERLTATWSLAELANPLVVARDVEVEVPQGARVVVSGLVAAAAFQAAQVRQVPHVAADYAVDAARGRVLLFLGGVRADALALISQDAALVARLAAEAEALWQRATPYREQRPLAEAPLRVGVPLEVQGVITDILARQGGYLLRLEEHGQSLGVKVQVDLAELNGQRVLVRGHVEREGGYPVLVASDVRRLE